MRSDNKTKGTRQWSSHSIGSKFQHNIFYFLIRSGGRRFAYFVLYFVVFYYIFFRPVIRARAEYYLSHRFPERKGIKRMFNNYRLSLELGKVLVDRAVIGILGPDQIKVKFDSRKELLGLVEEGNGIILLMSHVGCWQVAISALHFLNIKVNLLLHREEGDVAQQYFEHTSLSSPYRRIDPNGYLGGALEMVEVLNKGEALSIMGDRVFGSDKNTVLTDFFGDKVRFPYSAFKIASATGAPVVVIYSHKTGPDSYKLDLAEVIRVPENLGRSSEMFLPYVTQFAESLESFALDHPYQFFNFYDMKNSRVV